MSSSATRGALVGICAASASAPARALESESESEGPRMSPGILSELRRSGGARSEALPRPLVLVGETPDHELLDEPPPRIVGTGSAARRGDDLGGQLGVSGGARRTRTGSRRSAVSGRWRVRTALATTRAIRASPFSLATSGASSPRTLNPWTSPLIVDSVTPLSPSDGSTFSM